MTHEHILKMIEEVDPSDTAKLDEIDILVCEFINADKHWTFMRVARGWWTFNAGNGDFNIQPVRYTRSRDALKAIRPHLWTFDIQNTVYNGAFCHAEKMLNDGTIVDFDSYRRKTEELAELHAIISAIAYERGE